VRKTIVLVIAVLAAACGPSQPQAQVIPIATQAPPPPGEVACAMALLEGTLVLDVRTGLGVMAPDGPVIPVLWPNGWRALATSPVSLVDADGKVIAHLGDHLSMAGGVGNDDRWLACPFDMQVS
jgi:hypothetical protein